MMRDQAAELRNLVRRASRVSAQGPAPVLMAVAGGKGGVGATTLAINVALALSELGQRVVLADINVCRADIAPLCRIHEQASIADVLSARRDVHEALQPGPGGIQVLPGVWAPAEPTHISPANLERLLQQLRTLGRHAELVILDVGSGSHDLSRQLWSSADLVLLVTTADDVAIMDSYATIKTSCVENDTPIFVVLNQLDDVPDAEQVFARLAHSCQRFLMRHIECAGCVPHDVSADESAALRIPLWIQAPYSPAAEAIRQLAQFLQPRLERKVPSATH